MLDVTCCKCRNRIRFPFDLQTFSLSRSSSTRSPKLVRRTPAEVLKEYSGLVCPLTEVLESTERGALLWECRGALDRIIDSMVQSEHKERFGNLSSSMDATRSIYHCELQAVVPGRSSFVSQSLLSKQPAEVLAFYRERVELHGTVANIAAETSCQSCTTQ